MATGQILDVKFLGPGLIGGPSLPEERGVDENFDVESGPGITSRGVAGVSFPFRVPGCGAAVPLSSRPGQDGAVAGRCSDVGLHAGVKGVGGPVTRGGQGKGRGPVRCAPVVVAPVGARGRGSPMMGSPSPWWSTPPWRGSGGGGSGERRAGDGRVRWGAGAGGLALGQESVVMGAGCASGGAGPVPAAHQRPAGKRQDRARGRPIASGRGSHRCRRRRAPHGRGGPRVTALLVRLRSGSEVWVGEPSASDIDGKVYNPGGHKCHI